MAKIEIHVSSPANQVNRSDETPAAGAGEGASYGAKTGAGGAIVTGTYVGARLGCHGDWEGLVVITCPVGFVVGFASGLVAAVPAAAVGAVVGADKAQSEDSVAVAMATYDGVVKRIDPAEELRSRIITEIERRGAASVVDPRSTAHEPSTAVLDLDIDVLLHLKGRLEPDIWVEVEARASVREALKAEWLYERKWHYYAEMGEFFALSDQEGARLQEELEVVFGKMANAIVTDLFITTKAAPKVEPRRFEGEVVSIDGPSADSED